MYRDNLRHKSIFNLVFRLSFIQKLVHSQLY